jgi:hypothetical protein
MGMSFDAAEKDKMEFLRTCSLGLTNLLLCSMPPECAANALHFFLVDKSNKSGHWDSDMSSEVRRFISFMELNPRATARILAHMPEKVILGIFRGRGTGCACAIIGRIRPYLMEFNGELAERLFSPQYDPRVDRNIYLAKLLAMDPQDVLSTLKDYTNESDFYIHALESMIPYSTLAQRKKIVQILVALLNGGLLRYNECVGLVNETYVIRDDGDSIFRLEWNLVKWFRTLAEDLSDDMLARLIRERPEVRQQEFLKIFPEGRRKKVQDLIVSISAEEP